MDSASNLGSAVTLAGGVASFTTSSLTTGGHSITAVYNGDSNNATSTSAALTQIVNIVPNAPTIGLATAGNAQLYAAFKQRRQRHHELHGHGQPRRLHGHR
jgi:hypothetical protein